MTPKPTGFAFTADVVLALFLVIGLLVFATLPAQPAPKLEERRITDQFVDDLFVSLDHSGFVANQIDTNGFSALTLQNIYNRATTLLPSSYDLFLEMKSYSVDLDACRSTSDFESCFPDENVSTLTYGTPLPENAPFIHGRRIFLKQQPASQCSGSLSGPSASSPFLLAPTPFPSLSFQSVLDLNIQFDVNVSPAGPWTCDQDIDVTLSVTTNSGARKAVDMMLVFDRSGSMTYDYQLSTTDAQGLDVDDDFVYLADSTSGLRDINAVDPALPNTLDTYNTSGTARDVDAVGDYAFVADGTSGLHIINVSNPQDITLVSTLALGSDAYGVASNGNETYVLTAAGDTVDQSSSISTNRDLYIGRNASNLYAAQSFIPDVSFITGAQVNVRRQGNPSSALTVSIRSTLNGADLATGTIPVSSISTSYGDETVVFTSAASLTPGNTYYLVLTTASTSSSNYYLWAARNSNSYSDGQAYQNTSAQSWDADFETHYTNGLLKINTTTKNAPTILGSYTLTEPWRIFLNGTTAYVSDGSAGMHIFNVSANTPVLLGTYNPADTVYDAYVSGSYAYVSVDDLGLHIVNISNPASPSLTGSYNTPDNAYATRVHDNYAYVADGGSIQVIDVTTPASPTFILEHPSAWNYRDLDIKLVDETLWGFVAVDSGTEGLITINLNTGPKVAQAIAAAHTFVDFNCWNPAYDQMGLVTYASTATLDQTLTDDFNAISDELDTILASGGTATGDGINTATTHFGTTQTDVTNTGSQNQTIAFGQNATNLTAGQSFQPVLPYISRVDVYIRRVSNPSVPVTVELRTAISGTVIASTTIPVSSIGTSYALETATFPSLVSVSPGTTYYIVLSTSSNNATNYFQWGAQSSSPYSGGQAYQNASPQSSWDARFATYGGYTNPSALRFQILMSDGLTNAGANSSTAAVNAANNGIIIYAIGFGKDADADELENIATITGGKYYSALDQNALIDVYNVIANEIQLIASDANLVAGLPDEITLVSDGNGLIVGDTLFFDINTLEAPPWTSDYTINIPCSSALACSSTLLTIPSPGTYFEYVDANGTSQQQDWNVFATQTFQYRDLNISIISGALLGPGNTDITVRVESNGNLDTNASTVSFYLDAPPTNLLSTVSIPSLCGKLSPGCLNYYYEFTQNVPAEGELYAVVNADNAIPECTFDNQDVIYCYYSPETQFFTFEYWAWQRG